MIFVFLHSFLLFQFVFLFISVYRVSYRIVLYRIVVSRIPHRLFTQWNIPIAERLLRICNGKNATLSTLNDKLLYHFRIFSFFSRPKHGLMLFFFSSFDFYLSTEKKKKIHHELYMKWLFKRWRGGKRKNQTWKTFVWWNVVRFDEISIFYFDHKQSILNECDLSETRDSG